jgi:hypothetical protein
MDHSYKWAFGILALIILVSVGYGILTMPDKRNTMEKVGDAVHELPQGLDKAERQLEGRTPGQKVGDSVKDAGDKIKDNTGSEAAGQPVSQ